ncbi:MAG: oligopeptide/dipeptide transporter, ATPase subunit [Frankiales bacterium]|nr:oligopeptide/dipeptide transporter, ATPase subunit [Frankiales bacterium]
MVMAEHLLEAKGLTVTYGNGVRAVADVDLTVDRGEIVGLVGESGCGKSSLANTVLRLVKPESGSLLFDGIDLLTASKAELRAIRRRLQVIPQDPSTSLNPRLTIAQSVEFNLKVHRWGRKERQARVLEMFERVGIPAGYSNRYPHQLSGGQLQRVAIARALVTDPDLVVCDEAVSALDKSVQAQILNLLSELQRDLEVAFLFVSHDLTVVEHISDRVMVMYLGRIIEQGPASAILQSPQHPYSQALLASIPTRGQARAVIEGEPPSPVDPPSGCGFRTRCPHAIEACASYDNTPVPVTPTHEARCLRVKELVLSNPQPWRNQ